MRSARTRASELAFGRGGFVFADSSLEASPPRVAATVVEDARRCVIGPCRRLRGGTVAGTVRADTADMVHAVDAASNEPRALNESGCLLAWSRHARALVHPPTRRRAR